MIDDGDHVAASANNQAGPPRMSPLRVNPPQTLTMMDLEAGMEELCQNYPA